MPSQRAATVHQRRPGQSTVGQQAHAAAQPRRDRPRHALAQLPQQPGHLQRRMIGAIAFPGQRDGAMAIAQADLHAAQVLALGRLVEDQHDRAVPIAQQAARHLRLHAPGDQARVGQQPLDASSSAGGLGLAGHRQRHVPGIASPADGHRIGDRGQGIALMSMSRHEKLLHSRRPLT